jgi:aspartate aminotransferase-like enzyme
MKFKATITLGGLGLALLASELGGCGMLPQKGWGPPPPGAPPLVSDCAIVTIGSPTRYACNGKVYTSFDLEKQRLAWETAQNSETHPANIPVKY